MANILDIISAISPYGGTINKLRLLIANSKKHNHVLYHPRYKGDESEVSRFVDWYSEHNVTDYYGFYGRNIFKNAFEVSKIIKKHNIDIVHFYFNHEQSFAFLIKMLNPKVKMVRSFEGFDKNLSRFRRLAVRLSLPWVKNYIYISDFVKCSFEQMFPCLKGCNSTIIYNCPVKVCDSVTDVTKRTRILTMGGFSNVKNPILLIEAMKIVVKKFGRSDIILDFVGDGNLRPQCEQLITDYSLNDNIKIHGYIDNTTDYLNNAAIYVHPAIAEGFGIAVVEAMKMHCPCIVADKGALPELIVDGESGYIIDAYNAEEWAKRIIYLYDNLAVRKKMGESAFKRAQEKFSVESFVKNHDDFYDKLMAN